MLVRVGPVGMEGHRHRHTGLPKKCCFWACPARPPLLPPVRLVVKKPQNPLYKLFHEQRNTKKHYIMTYFLPVPTSFLTGTSAQLQICTYLFLSRTAAVSYTTDRSTASSGYTDIDVGANVVTLEGVLALRVVSGAHSESGASVGRSYLYGGTASRRPPKTARRPPKTASWILSASPS